MLTLQVGDRGIAEELAQEALLRAAQHWPRVARMADPSAWLLKVGTNLARSSLRRHYAERRARARLAAAPAPPIEDQADVIAVRTALRALPARQRTAIVLRRYGGLSVRETAAAMGVAEGTVRALCHQAVGSLRAELGLSQEVARD